MPAIALISEHASPRAVDGGSDIGGQSIYVANVAMQLAQSGFDVDVFSRRDHPELEEVIKWKPGVRLVHLPAGPAVPLPAEELLPHMTEFAAALERFFDARAEPYALVHANFFLSAWAALPLVRQRGLPLVTTFHGLGRVQRALEGDADRFPDERFAIEDAIVKSSDRIIAMSPQDHQDLIDHYDAAPWKVEVVPGGVDPVELTPARRAIARRKLGWGRDRFTLLHVGRIVPRRDIENIIRAVARLKQTYGIEALFYIVGGDAREPDATRTPEIARLTALAEKFGVADEVRFVGQRDRHELSLYYSAADVFVTTPWYEPFGIAPIEAMACGVPVIGSAVGGIKSTVVDGLTGSLVPPRDSEALAARLANLYAKPALRRVMGRAGRKRALKLYTWSRVARSLEQIYAHFAHEAWPQRAVRTAEAVAVSI